MPSASAISQHIEKVKKKQAGGAKGGTTNSTAGASRKGPVTPRKPTTPKTPTSSAKRKRTNMSDEDDSEPDLSKVKLSQEDGVGRRGSLSRLSKESSKKYGESSGDEDTDDDGENEAAGPGLANEPEDGNIFKGESIDFDGTTDVKPAVQPFDVNKDWRGNWLPSRKTFNRSGVVDPADESDVSTFSETLN